MNKVKTIPSFYIMGASTQTSNLREMSPSSAKIGPLWEKFFGDNAISSIPNMKDNERIYGVYSGYTTEGNDIFYTLTIGVEVDSIDDVPKGLTVIEIPEQKYTIFETKTGPAEDVLLETWKNIWKSDVETLNGERAFLYDFECYLGEDISDPQHAKAKIYIGIQ